MAALVRLTRGLGICTVAVIALAGCAASEEADSSPTTPASSRPTVVAPSSTTLTRVAPTTTVASAPPTTTLEPVAPPTTAAAATAIMPAVVCMNLQEAQNTIQSAGVFFSRSTDATGKGRAQVMDRNWIVVAQDPAPGTAIGEGQAVLSVVKYGEPHPC